MNPTLRKFGVLSMAFALLAGCLNQEELARLMDKRDKGSQPKATPVPEPASKALRGTIGQMVTVDGMQMIQVSGFGLVVDLVDTGGRDGPDEIRKYLTKEIRRRDRPGMPSASASEMLEDLDTVMVEVTGFIPAGAQKGDRFDIQVKALGSECTSIVGGRLVLCELKKYAATPSGVIGGKTLAKAAGPIFVSPFNIEGKHANAVDLRLGKVLGGGMTVIDRKVKLVLNHASYGNARRIVNRLNSRFRVTDPVAEAISGSNIELSIPKFYKESKRWYLERVSHTHLASTPGRLEQISLSLRDEFGRPDAPLNDIALAWEAIGEVVLPQVREFYDHRVPAVSFHAGRTGLRLGDTTGMEIIARYARMANSPFRMEAIEELGRGYADKRLYRAGQYLARLLNDEENEIRIRAYEALRRAPHPAIDSTVLDQDNMVLDVVESTGKYLIYARQTKAPRLVLFGSQMGCRPPAIFPGQTQRGRVILTQLSASPGDDSLKLVYTNKRNKSISPALDVDLNVAQLVHFLADSPIQDVDMQPLALGVPYSEVVDILYSFCRNGTIAADFIAEDLTGKDRASFGTERDRPESEF